MLRLLELAGGIVEIIARAVELRRRLLHLAILESQILAQLHEAVQRIRIDLSKGKVIPFPGAKEA